MPLVRLYQPGGRYRCLLSRLDPEHTNIAFGLYDLGVGLPEIGYIHLDVITSWRNAMGPTIERDESFKPKRSLFLYWEMWRDETLQRELAGQPEDPAGRRHKLITPMPSFSKRPATPAACLRS